MIRKTTLVLAVATIAVISGVAVPSFAADDNPVLETYTALALNMNAGPGPNAGRMTIRIRNWSTEEQRTALLQVLKDKGSEELVKALRKEPEVGNMNFTGSLGYDLRYARSTQQGETRHIIFATDRPVSGVEIMRNSRSLDYGVTIIHLALGPDGKGTGELLVGAELSLDATTHEITVEHLGTQPIKLNQVEMQVPKKKK
jgi:hypothetical protein